MRTVRYSVAMSLDGYLADPHGGYDWIVIDPEIDFGEMFKGYDTVLMGRKSYEITRQQGGYEMPGQKAYVFSKTLKQSDVPNATVSNDPAKTVAELKQAKGKDIWLFGGGELFRSLLELRLVDAIEVAVIPVLLGAGVPLLPKTTQRVSLKLTKQKLFKKTGTVLLNYDVKYGKRRGGNEGC
jgi:dihydrofolate reductase